MGFDQLSRIHTKLHSSHVLEESVKVKEVATIPFFITEYLSLLYPHVIILQDLFCFHIIFYLIMISKWVSVCDKINNAK